MSEFVRGFGAGLEALPRLLPDLPRIFSHICALLRALCRFCRTRRCRDKRGCCVDLPPVTYKRPDPLIYSQHYLMAQGLSVTWDNPDIQLYENGVPVSSSALKADTEYEVEMRIWNNSYDAPAIGLGVELSYLSFGAGTTSHHVGSTTADLGVKGSSQCPAFARIPWRTPKGQGHYCLQARLQWGDDANPDNNLGQENTNVGVTQSPAEFVMKVGNQAGRPRRFELEVDMFAPPTPPECPPEQPWDPQDELLPNQRANTPAPYRSRLEESRARWKQALAAQGYGSDPVGADWDVKIEPQQFTLDANQEREVRVSIEPRFPGFVGPQPFNVHAFAFGAQGPRQLVGGVTLIVRGGEK